MRFSVEEWRREWVSVRVCCVWEKQRERVRGSWVEDEKGTVFVPIEKKERKNSGQSECADGNVANYGGEQRIKRKPVGGKKKKSFPRTSKQKDARGQGRKEGILQRQQTGIEMMMMMGRHARKGHIFMLGRHGSRLRGALLTRSALFAFFGHSNCQHYRSVRCQAEWKDQDARAFGSTEHRWKPMVDVLSGQAGPSFSSLSFLFRCFHCLVHVCLWYLDHAFNPHFRKWPSHYLITVSTAWTNTTYVGTSWWASLQPLVHIFVLCWQNWA